MTTDTTEQAITEVSLAVDNDADPTAMLCLRFRCKIDGETYRLFEAFPQGLTIDQIGTLLNGFGDALRVFSAVHDEPGCTKDIPDEAKQIHLDFEAQCKADKSAGV